MAKPQGYLTSLLATHTGTYKCNKLELRIMMLNAEKTLKSAEGSAKIANVTSDMQAALEAKRKELGENPSSEEYKQNMAECESIENEYQIIIQQITDQMKQAEDIIQTQLDSLEVQLEANREMLEKNKENVQAKAENAGYFNS